MARPKFHTQTKTVLDGDMVTESGNTSAAVSTDVDFVVNVEPAYVTYPQNEISGEITRSRRIARFLSQYKWYYPQRDNPDVNLDEAWSYFEHYVLPRRFCDEQGISDGSFVKAPRGESKRPTRLYPITMPQRELADFGIGIGLYFATLRALAGICFIVGIVNIPVMVHYASDNYSKYQENVTWGRFAAICTDREFVPCPNCKGSDGLEILHQGGYSFASKNMCIVDGKYGWYSICSLMIFTIFFFVLGRYQRKIEICYDENEQTCTDYSVLIKNPLPEVYNPEQYKEYFESLTESPVTAVTIALDNRRLLTALVNRRKLLRRLDLLRGGKNRGQLNGRSNSTTTPCREDWEELKPELTNTGTYIARMEELRIIANIKRYEMQIDELCEVDCRPTGVYVTFEKEYGQRIALHEHSVSFLEDCGFLVADDESIATQYLFHGVHLHCEVPPEPDSVRWIDLGRSFGEKVFLHMLFLGATCSIAVANAFVIDLTKEAEFSNGVGYSAIIISCSNIVVPELCKILNKQECYETDGKSQIGLYVKITLVRWANTALLIFILIDHSKFLSEDSGGAIVRIASILFVEMIFTPFVQSLDFLGTFRKHVVAPRCTTQVDMNLNFQGTFYLLAERYTDATKVLFVALFYAVLFPGGYLMCGVTLTVYYINDRFCITRVWKPAPLVGTELTKFSRKFFFSTALFAFSVMTAYFWAGFPYDNLCSCKEGSGTGCDEAYPMDLEYKLTDRDDSTVYTTITDTTKYYYFCRQDIIKDGIFPPIPSLAPSFVWMTNDQKNMTEILGWLSIVIMIGVGQMMFGNDLIDAIKKLYSFAYDPFEVKDQNVDFSCVDGIFGYIPSVMDGGIEYPLIACDIKDIDKKLIGWSEPSNGYESWNLISDIPVNSRNGISVSDGVHLFSIVGHYPPEWRARELAMGEY